MRTRPTGDRGVTAVLFALFLTAILASASLAVDMGSARQVAGRIQSATDASALAAAQELALRLDGTDAGVARAVAASFVARNLNGSTATATPVPCPAGAAVAVAANAVCFTSGRSAIVVETPYAIAGQPLSARHFIAVSACEDTPTYFAATIGLRSPRVCRQAVARRYQAGLSYGRGLITVDPTACPGLEIQGDSDIEIVSDGGVFIDSTCPTAMAGLGAKWKLSGAVISMVGDYLFNSCAGATCTAGRAPLVGQPAMGDPLGGLPAPPEPADPAVCTTTDSITRCTPGYHDAEESFGNGTGAVVLEPGIHWFAAGVSFGNRDVRVEGPPSEDPGDGSAPGSGTGAGALVYVHSGSFDLSGHGVATLTPPTKGTYAGISVFSGKDNTSTAKVTGNTGSTVGTVYVPKGRLEFGGSTSWTVTGMVVSARTHLFGHMALHIDPKEPAGARPPVEDLGLER